MFINQIYIWILLSKSRWTGLNSMRLEWRAYLKSKSSKLEDKFQREENGEDDVEGVEESCVQLKYWNIFYHQLSRHEGTWFFMQLPNEGTSRDILPWAVDSTSWLGTVCWAWWRRRLCTRKLATLRTPTTCTGSGSLGCNVAQASRSTQTRCSFAERGQQLDLDATDCGPIKKDSRLNPLNKKLCGSESQNLNKIHAFYKK